MRSIPIDAFLEEEEGRRGLDAAPGPASFRGRNWGSLVAEGRSARTGADRGRWRIGQLALVVEKRYRGAMLRRFAEEIGESYASVRRYRWVVGRYEAGVRFRFPNLSFSHFQAVAGIPDRRRWLERADRGGWSVDRLTRESRVSRARPDPADRFRRPVTAAARMLAELSELDDDSIAEAGWLSPALDDLAVEVERLRARVRAAGRASTLLLDRYRARAGAARKGRGHRDGNGRARDGRPARARRSAG